MNNNLNILYISYVYPPDAGSGTYRSLYFANNLAKIGNRVIILTVDVASFHRSATFDSSLLDCVEPSIVIERVRAFRPLENLLAIKGWIGQLFCKKNIHKEEKADQLISVNSKSKNSLRYVKDILTDFLSCPDIHSGWIPFAVLRGLKLIRNSKIDCIYATGGPWSALVAASLLHDMTKIPLVTDFRDPWISNPNMSNKSKFFKLIEYQLEKHVVKSSSRIVANTDELGQDFISRYPFLLKRNIHTITNGFEQISDTCKNIYGEKFIIVHVGELYMSRNPLKLILAIKNLFLQGKVSPDRFSIEFVGGFSIEDPALHELLNEKSLVDVVKVFPRVSHGEVLMIQQRATVLLLIQPGFHLQIPRKLYEYISFRKPVLAIADENGATAHLVQKKRLGTVVSNDTKEIEDALLAMYSSWENKTLKILPVEELQEFNNSVLSGRLSNVILEASRKSK